MDQNSNVRITLDSDNDRDSETDSDSKHGNVVNLPNKLKDLVVKDPVDRSAHHNNHLHPLKAALGVKSLHVPSASVGSTESITTAPGPDPDKRPGMPIYRGSYSKTPNKTPKASSSNLAAMYQTLGAAGSPENKSSGLATPVVPNRNPDLVVRASYLNFKLNRLLDKDTEIRKSYDVEELREGFFDAVFASSNKLESAIQQDYKNGRYSDNLRPGDNEPPSPPNDYLRYLNYFRTFRHSVDRTKVFKLTKVFVAVFIAYVLCLIDVVATWLGPLSFFMPFATIFHHPARTFGSQLEITLLSVLGGCIGLAWSALAIYVSSSTAPARNGYAGVHATSVLLAIFIASWIRATFMRFHHLIQTFSFTIIVMETVDVSPSLHWTKVWNFGIPYLFGLLIALACNLVIMPDFGQNAIMESLALTLAEVRKYNCSLTSNDEQERDSARKSLNTRSLKLSESFRELCNEICLLPLPSRDLVSIRNSIQVVIGRIKAVPRPGSFFMHTESSYLEGGNNNDINTNSELVNLIRSHFEGITRELVTNIEKCLEASIDYVDYLWYVSKSNTDNKSPTDSLRCQKANITTSLEQLREHFYTIADLKGYSFQKILQVPEAVNFFLYLYYIGETARVVTDLTSVVEKHSEKGRHWSVCWPIYPWRRALRRTTIQITHDLGGQSAAYYYQTRKDIDDVFHKISSSNTSTNIFDRSWDRLMKKNQIIIRDEQRGTLHRFWVLIHRLQDFETRFAFKSSVCITLLSLPAWLDQSKVWYFKYDMFLCVLSSYMFFHPRVAGNLQDVIVRSTFCVLGCVWAGISVRADWFNRVVLAVFCAIFMVPMLYRFVLSAHTRSGLMACVSFTMVSLTILEKHRLLQHHDTSIFTATWTRLLALEVGMLVTIVVNWILWPYVARQEVRKSVAKLLMHIGQTFKIITERYVYRDKDDIPTDVTLQLAEMREGRMLQGIDSLRQLLQTTNHEISITDDFDAQLYERVIQSCEVIFQKVSEARISTLHFNVWDSDGSKDKTAQLLSLRRDAVASTVFILHILSGAYRLKNRVPRYLPSSALSRKLLFDKITELRESDSMDGQRENKKDNKKDNKKGTYTSEDSEEEDESDDDENKELLLFNKDGLQSQLTSKLNRSAFWTNVHETAYSRALTETTEELEKLIAYSKLVLGQDYL